MSQSPDEDSLSSDTRKVNPSVIEAMRKSQSPDEDSLSSDSKHGACEIFHKDWSQSPDEDSLSSDASAIFSTSARLASIPGLNPLTRIHCLPTGKE